MIKRAILGLALMLATTPAYTADLPPAPSTDTAVEEVHIPGVSGWYLRGDLGYSFNKIGGAQMIVTGATTYSDITNAKNNDNFTAGLGVGYQVNDILRLDGTVDYLTTSNFSGRNTPGCTVAGPCSGAVTATMSGVALMANAYADLGTWASITPYVGGGVGATMVNWEAAQSVACSIATPTNCDPAVNFSGKNDWRFSWALMAGASYDVSCNLKADIGYRYLHVDGGGIFSANGAGPANDNGFQMHQIKGGVRYIFNGCDQTSSSDTGGGNRFKAPDPYFPAKSSF